MIGPIVVALLGLLVLTLLISSIVFYVQFCNSPERRWQQQIFALVTAARKRLEGEKRNLRKIGSEHELEAGALREEAFRSYVAEISISQLEAYAGIGPVTLAKLRGAGYVNLISLRNARPLIPGLGEKRLRDIDLAVRDLLAKARDAFDTGACQQAQALPQKLQQMASERDRRQSHSRARIQAAEEVAQRLRGPEAIARQGTFWRWLRPRLEEKLASSEIKETPLPDLDAAIRSADARAAQVWEAKHRGGPVPVAGHGHTHSSASDAATLPVALRKPIQRVQETPPTHTPAPDWVHDMAEDAHVLLMDLTIQFALAAARADGPVTAAERDLVRRHLRQRFAYNQALLNRAEAYCAHYESAAIDMERCLRQIKEKFSTAHRTALMDFVRQIVVVSSHGSESSQTFLKTLAQQLGVALVPLASPAPTPKSTGPPRPLAQPRAVAPPIAPSPTPPAQVAAAPAHLAASAVVRAPAASTAPPPRLALRASPAPARPSSPATARAPEATREECLTLLEIPPSAPVSADLVRRQWNLLSERLAAEKAAKMGPEFARMAENKRAAVRRAAETLLDLMGEKLDVNPAAPSKQPLRDNPDLDEIFGGT